MEIVRKQNKMFWVRGISACTVVLQRGNLHISYRLNGTFSQSNNIFLTYRKEIELNIF
jgi:hypothetical protein